MASIEESVIGGNDLAKIGNYYLFINHPADENVQKFENELQDFAQDMCDRKDLIDNTQRPVFHKANVYKSIKNDTNSYTLQFFLYSTSCWDNKINDKVMEELNTKFNLEQDVSFEVTELIRDVKRDPFKYENDKDKQGSDQIPGNCFEKFIYWWLIVPSVQWKLFGLLYQMYTFDIFHQGFFAKFVHFFTIPTNVMLSMCFLAQFSFFGVRAGSGAFTVNGGLALMIILAVLYLLMGINAKSIPWGFATSIAIFVCWLTGNLWYVVYKTPTNPWYNPTTCATNPILWSYIMSFIQALSHLMTGSLPPYITGYSHWEVLHFFFCKKPENEEKKRTSIFFILMDLLGFFIFSVAVAWFSWPHLIGTEIIYIMAGIGYQPDFFKKFYTVCEKAESTGDPVINHFPREWKDLTQPDKCKQHDDNLPKGTKKD